MIKDSGQAKMNALDKWQKCVRLEIGENDESV